MHLLDPSRELFLEVIEVGFEAVESFEDLLNHLVVVLLLERLRRLGELDRLDCLLKVLDLLSELLYLPFVLFDLVVCLEQHLLVVDDQVLESLDLRLQVHEVCLLVNLA